MPNLTDALSAVDATIDCEHDAGVVQITLRNTGKRNAMTRRMWQQLRDLFCSQFNSCSRPHLLGKTPVLCIIIKGESGHFSAGGDISEYASFRFDEASLRQFHEEEVAPALQALLDCDVPLIAQIEGNCMGGGLEIAACCDIRIAGRGATLGAPIAKLGFPMAPQEAAIVMRAVGELTAREMLLEARTLSAEAMQARGFINRVVDDAAVAQEVMQTALRLSTLSPQAARLNKQTLRALTAQFSTKNTPQAQQNRAQVATDLIANAYHYSDSFEHREGINAFMEKRQPYFQR